MHAHFMIRLVRRKNASVAELVMHAHFISARMQLVDSSQICLCGGIGRRSGFKITGVYKVQGDLKR